MKRNPIFLVAGIVLFIALGNFPYSYYQLLRFFICGVRSYGGVFSLSTEKTSWVWTLGIIALLFNPFIKFHLGRDTWKVAVLLSGIIFLVYYIKK